MAPSPPSSVSAVDPGRNRFLQFCPPSFFSFVAFSKVSPSCSHPKFLIRRRTAPFSKFLFKKKKKKKREARLLFRFIGVTSPFPCCGSLASFFVLWELRLLFRFVGVSPPFPYCGSPASFSVSWELRLLFRFVGVSSSYDDSFSFSSRPRSPVSST